MRVFLGSGPLRVSVVTKVTHGSFYATPRVSTRFLDWNRLYMLFIVYSSYVKPISGVGIEMSVVEV